MLVIRAVRSPTFADRVKSSQLRSGQRLVQIETSILGLYLQTNAVMIAPFLFIGLDADMDRLIDYLFFVGPGRGSVFRRSPSLKRSKSLLGNGIEPLSTWHKISRPVPTILCHFPATQHKDLELPADVAYFCQPEGPCVQLSDPKLHVFMLTDTESNIHTYGICFSIPHLFDPLLKAQVPSSAVSKGKVWEVNDSESVCIQEWGVLSVCILTRHPFYQFFAKCLRTLLHFVNHFGGKDLNWNALIQAQMNAMKSQQNGHAHSNQRQIVLEVQEWIERLVALQAPSPGINILEVELEVDPAMIVCYPPPNRLPLFELSVHRLFQRLEVCLVIDIYKLVLSEEKVRITQITIQVFPCIKLV